MLLCSTLALFLNTVCINCEMVVLPTSIPTALLRTHPALDYADNDRLYNLFVVVGQTFSTSSPTIPASSPDPFYITVTARILIEPHPSCLVTL